MLTKPMLAATLRRVGEIRFPSVCSPKVDGIRCLVHEGQALTRAFKLVPNQHIQRLVSALPSGLDGELMLEDATFNDIQSAVMTQSGTPDFQYWLFDRYHETAEYWYRLHGLRDLHLPTWCMILDYRVIETLDDFRIYEDECLARGFEGVMLRDAHGQYKCGRSTKREYGLCKWKRFHDGEAMVLSCHEGTTNLNPQVPNAFGRMRRPGGSSGHVPRGTFGYMVVRDVQTGVEFRIGSGFNDALRAAIHAEPRLYYGRIVTYRCQLEGAKDKPRFPRFLGFRAPEDMS